MTGITGLGTTFNLPNYVGELFALSPEDTPFTTAIGGLTGGESTTSTTFEWQTFDLRAADGSRQRLEGADAPTAEERARAKVTNRVEIHQEAVTVSYTKQAAVGQFHTTGASHPGAVGIAGTNPVLNEVDWQLDQQLKMIKRDIEQSFLTNVGVDWPDNTAARKTTGLISAITTNVTNKGAALGAGVAVTLQAAADTVTNTAHGLNDGDQVIFADIATTAGISVDTVYYVRDKTANTFKIAATLGGAAIDLTTGDGTANCRKLVALSKAAILDAMQGVWTAGGIQESETRTLIVGATQKRMLTDVFVTQSNYREMSRNVGGVNLTMVETDFGTLNIMLNRFMPAHKVVICSLEQCAPVFLQVPDKGFLFTEPLAKTGASDKYQIYGEVGLKWGAETHHGVITGFTV